ncbi:BPSS1780 family membrane protein [Propionivibrio sp.]|uniref:BPSS1780 family membrane protein n=1 Tax=Propionivibrio sp. TaxID=2212460 RepID=UPI003BF0A7A2
MEPFPIPAPAFNGNSRVVAAGNAFEWLKQGWALFVVNPGLWIAMTIVLLVVVLGLNIVPLVGTLAAQLLTPLLGAGMLLACQKVSNGETLEIADLFAGFKQNTGNLVMLGVLYMAAMLAILLIVFVLGGGSMAGGLMMGRPAGIGLAFGGLMLAMLISLALSVPLVMAIWFAPALVFFNNMPPVEALKASFNACLKNTLPFLVYGLIMLVLMFFAALPVGLGFLVLIPVIFGSVYASYRDIFVAN